MQRSGNLHFVLKNKARIYAWLLVGFIPIWAYGLTERLIEPNPTLERLFPLIAGVPLMISLWIAIRRWEAIERRKMPKRVRILLLALSSFTALAALGGVICEICLICA